MANAADGYLADWLPHEAQLAALDWRVAELEAQLAALDWREITETDLPEIGQQVLACFKGQFQWVIFPATMTRHQGVFAVGHAKPTHWMPMPAPPAPRSCEEHEWLTR
jgi:hypothetical protein